MLVHQPVQGGVARHVGDLARGLEAAGHEVLLCAPAPLPSAAGRHIPLEMGRAVSPGRDLRSARDLVALIGRLGPQLVHAHSSKAGAVARLARLAHPRMPVVYSPHGYAFAGHFDSELERRAYRYAEIGLSPLASRVIGVCEAEARLARSVGPPRRVRVVHNGVAQAEPIQVRAGRDRAPLVCTLTQLRPGKGVETLLDAVARLNGGAADSQLVVWGDGPDLGALRQRARALGIAERVRFAGATPDPLGAISDADVFVLPSLAEAFPYVVLEAMSVGLPVIASDVGGVREALDDGCAGVLVAPGDPNALAAALDSLLCDASAAAEVATAGARRVKSSFGLEQMIRGTLAVYDELL